MPYDEKLADKLRRTLNTRPGITEQRMFGGLCFLLRGNMLCGINGERLMFRVGKAQDAEALSRPGARPMDITGKVMAGFVFVDSRACDGRAIGRWIDLAEKYVGALPDKIKKTPRSPARSAQA
jgi:TfoX/Sxy family transcriptional regulator of competence genes